MEVSGQIGRRGPLLEGAHDGAEPRSRTKFATVSIMNYVSLPYLK